MQPLSGQSGPNREPTVHVEETGEREGSPSQLPLVKRLGADMRRDQQISSNALTIPPHIEHSPLQGNKGDCFPPSRRISTVMPVLRPWIPPSSPQHTRFSVTINNQPVTPVTTDTTQKRPLPLGQSQQAGLASKKRRKISFYPESKEVLSWFRPSSELMEIFKTTYGESYRALLERDYPIAENEKRELQDIQINKLYRGVYEKTAEFIQKLGAIWRDPSRMILPSVKLFQVEILNYSTLPMFFDIKRIRKGVEKLSCPMEMFAYLFISLTHLRQDIVQAILSSDAFRKINFENVASIKSRLFNSLLAISIKYNFIEVVKKLFEHYKFDRIDKLIHQAALNGCPEILQEMISRKKDNCRGWENHQAIALLIQKIKEREEVDEVKKGLQDILNNNSSSTFSNVDIMLAALAKATDFGNREIVIFILEQKNLSEIVETDFYRILEIAIQAQKSNNREIAKAICSYIQETDFSSTFMVRILSTAMRLDKGVFLSMVSYRRNVLHLLAEHKSFSKITSHDLGELFYLAKERKEWEFAKKITQHPNFSQIDSAVLLVVLKGVIIAVDFEGKQELEQSIIRQINFQECKRGTIIMQLLKEVVVLLDGLASSKVNDEMIEELLKYMPPQEEPFFCCSQYLYHFSGKKICI